MVKYLIAMVGFYSLLTLIPPNVTGQCVECDPSCDMSTESYRYDMWLCSCPTDSVCTTTGICTECYYDGMELCIDMWNGCETIYQSSYSWNCECEQTTD